MKKQREREKDQFYERLDRTYQQCPSYDIKIILGDMNAKVGKNMIFYILLTVHLDVILINDQLDSLFLNVFISCLYMFRATSAHHQEVQVPF